MRDQPDQNRRRLMARLGIGALTAYAAPMLTGYDTANASGGSGGSGESRGGSGGRSSRVEPSRVVRRRKVSEPTPAPPELVLFISPARLGADTDTRLQGASYKIVQQRLLANGNIYRLQLPPGRDVPEALAELAQLFPDAVFDRNTLYTPEEFICSTGSCDAHTAIGWSGWSGSNIPRIGIIDTGVNPNHPALSGQKLHVYQTEMNERTAAGRQHGTAVASLLIGATDSRSPGLLPEAELFAVEAFHRGSGGEAADAYALAEAIDYLLEARVHVINMSFSGAENAVLHAMIRQARELGVGIVAAAGNGGPGAAPSYPAAWPEVIAVTAVNAALKPWRQANRGAWVTLAAPGVNLWTAASVSGGRLRSGTSYAAPFVTAVLAVERARDPSLDLESATARMIACAKDLGDAGYDETFGYGLVSSPDQCLKSITSKNMSIFNISVE